MVLREGYGDGVARDTSQHNGQRKHHLATVRAFVRAVIPEIALNLDEILFRTGEHDRERTRN